MGGGEMNLANHQSTQTVKMLLVGDSGAAKTGSLISLVKADYKLRVLDYDNGLDILAKLVREQCPEKAANVDYQTLRDKRKTTGTQTVFDGTPMAFTKGMQLLDHWKYKAEDGTEVDLGKPSEWGPDTVIVVDSLKFMGDAAYNRAEALNPGAKDGRVLYGVGQEGIMQVLDILTSDWIKCHVVVITHVQLQERGDGTTKGFPAALGKALGPEIPKYFNSIVMAETAGSGASFKRQLRTTPTAFLDLKNPGGEKIPAILSVNTGLAEFFNALRA